MKLLNRQLWLNFLALLPATGLTLLTISVAFLRFYDEQDFAVVEFIPQPRLGRNRLTVAALLVALVNFSVEWNRRNRETDRLAEEAQRRAEEELRKSGKELRSEDERLAELLSKIDGSFSKHGINLPLAKKPKQP